MTNIILEKNDIETQNQNKNKNDNNNDNNENKKQKNDIYICCAGKAGVIKVINLNDMCLQQILKGHTAEIFHLSNHSKYMHIIISSSADSTARIWNVNV